MANQEVLNGHQVIALTIKSYGIENVFGVVGIPITQLGYRLVEAGVRFVGFRNEQVRASATVHCFVVFPGP